jgi:hypothetical protein
LSSQAIFLLSIPPNAKGQRQRKKPKKVGLGRLSAVPTRYKHEKPVETGNDRINDPI